MYGSNENKFEWCQNGVENETFSELCYSLEVFTLFCRCCLTHSNKTNEFNKKVEFNKILWEIKANNANELNRIVDFVYNK